ncbi:hypothetical protein OAB52_03300 [Candidatus Thioglobus sp.]|nr:hypothetical protein [Candidatus Thioglobus sp.]
MIILGISEEHDSGVSIVENGRIIYSVNEERFSRSKQQGGFPKNSIEHAFMFLKSKGLEGEVKGVALASKIHTPQRLPEDLKNDSKSSYILAISFIRFVSRSSVFLKILHNASLVSALAIVMQIFQRDRRKRWASFLKDNSLAGVDFEIFDHHYCHATSAYFSSGFSDCFVLTFDASGDGFCSRFYKCSAGNMQLLHSLPFTQSIGYYYTIITLSLGFKFGQEGKITGLSARGNPKKVIPLIRERINYVSGKLRFENRGLHYSDEIDYFKQKLANYSREDVSAAIQKCLEEDVTNYLSDMIVKFNLGRQDIALAGGIFSNVLLNRRIADLENIKTVFVHPNMNDGGLANGAAFALSKRLLEDYKPYEISNMYLGDEYTENEIEKEIHKYNFSYKKYENIEYEIAKLLSEKKVVARFSGRMENGPRALGNRSILYQASNSEVNQWLNKRLNRSEFMPFAPAVMEEYANKYFVLKGQELSSRFMTMASTVTEICRKKCPAIVHIDGTARPQIVYKDSSPKFHRIIEEYFKITGVPVIVNTSFNMHEEPIVESPKSALDAFSRGKLDYLAIHNFLVFLNN